MRNVIGADAGLGGDIFSGAFLPLPTNGRDRSQGSAARPVWPGLRGTPG